MDRQNRRFARQITMIESRMPRLGGTLGALSLPHRIWLRVPVALLLILGGLVGFLPVVGFWMLPLGVLLLAIDLPRLRPAVGAAFVRARASWRRWRR